MPVSAIILAAGASSRMGRTKALLPLGSETFVSRLVRVFSRDCDPVIVALGYHADAVGEHLATLPESAVIAVNLAPENGQLSSLQTALRLVPATAEGFLFVPVDCPTMKEETVRRVVDAFRSRSAGTLFVVPSFQGKHGHPVCAAMEIARELLALAQTASAREVVHAHRAETLYIEVDDPGILTDVDDPAAYRRLSEVT